MWVEVGSDAPAFASRAGRWLAGEPFTANVIAVLVQGVLAGSRSTMPDPAWVLIIDDDGVVFGAAMHTSPIGVFLPRLPSGAAASVAHAFVAAGRVVAGASGELSAVGEFATAWAAATGTRAVQVRAERMFRMARLIPPTDVPGSARIAGPDQLGPVANLMRAFSTEIHASGAELAEASDTARRRVIAAEVALWEHGGVVVSLAAVSAAAAGTARIGPVYTPVEHRRRGFAAAVTAAAAGHARSAGAGEVVLYTDLGNPTANGVYRRIGFDPVFDARRVAFIAPDTGPPG